jgi:hypothetical protein
VAVDVQELTTTYGEEVRRARTETLLRFRAVLAAEIEAHPEDRDAFLSTVLRMLREQREAFREAGNEVLEDIVLDAMDIVTGWSAHAVRLH